MSHFKTSLNRSSRKRLRSRACGGLESLEPRTLLHAEMLLDYNSEPIGLHPQNLTVYQDQVYFVLPSSQAQRKDELWKTDGTTAGTSIVRQLDADAISLMEVVDDRLLMVRRDGASFYLDAFDGENFVQLTRLLTSEPYYRHFEFFTTPHGTTLVRASGDMTGTGIWETDLTPEGTTRIYTFDSHRGGSTLKQTTSGDGMYFNGSGPVFSCCNDQMWYVDLAAAEFEPQLLTVAIDGYVRRPVSVGEHAYFTVHNEDAGLQLWFSDGTAAGTTLLMPIPSLSYTSSLTKKAVHQDSFYFVVDDDTGAQLWRHNVENGLERLTSGEVNAGNLHSIAGDLFFTNQTTSQVDLYRIQDETLPTLVESFPADGFSITQAGERLLVSAIDDHDTLDVWMVGDGAPQPMVSLAGHDSIGQFHQYKDGFVFLTSGPTESSLWHSNSAGTRVRRIGAVPGDSGTFTVYNDKLVFTGTGPNGNVLWQFDGQAANTILDTRYQTKSSYMYRFFVAGKKPIILLSNGSYRTNSQASFHVYTSWGTAATTTRLSDDKLTVSVLSELTFVQAGDEQVYVVGAWADDPFQLHRIDLNTLESELVADPTVVTEANPRVGVSNRDFYYYDGADEPNVGSITFDGVSYLPAKTSHGTYFIPVSRDRAGVIHRVDESGTVEAVVDLEQYGISPQHGQTRIVALGDLLYFSPRHPDYGAELWVSDGTSAGTRMLRDIKPGPASGAPNWSTVTPHGDLVYFVAGHPDYGAELWRTDGTPEGTRLVHDANPGPAGSNTHILGGAGKALYFTANDGTHGHEIWATLAEGPSTGIAGDLNEDGLLSELDFALLRAAFGRESKPDSHADMNDDGRVDFDDFLLLSAEFR